MKKILVCGSRFWKKRRPIELALMKAKPDLVIHGESRGADKIAGDIAHAMGIVVCGVPADWKKFGKKAGPIRNQFMLDLNPDEVIAFHSDIENSKGTKDMVERARKKNIPVKIITK